MGVDSKKNDVREVWKGIPNYDIRYEASTFGNVRNTKNKKVLKAYWTKQGYLKLSLYSNKETKDTVLVHRLKEGNPSINHKDGNKENNYINNLEWVTPKENTKHAWSTGLCTISEEKKEFLRTLSLGAVRSKETREKMSNAKKGHIPSEKTKEKISKTLKGRYCGSNKSSSKLNEIKVSHIKYFLEKGTYTGRAIAKKYGVTPSMISRIRHRKVWKSIMPLNPEVQK